MTFFTFYEIQFLPLSIIFSLANSPCTSLALVLLFMVGLGSIWTITVIFAIRGLLQGIHGPAVQAIVPLMIPKSKISRFNGFNMFISTGVRILGPVFAGFLFGIGIEFKQILWIDVITFGIAIIPALIVKIPSLPKQEKEVELQGENKEKEQ